MKHFFNYKNSIIRKKPLATFFLDIQTEKMTSFMEEMYHLFQVKFFKK